MRTSTSCGKNASCAAAAAAGAARVGGSGGGAYAAPLRRRMVVLLRVLVLIEKQDEAKIYLFLTPRVMVIGAYEGFLGGKQGKVKKRPKFCSICL
jgi:hypothetical protein